MVLLFLFTCATASFAADALLSWDRNTEPTVTGYKVYYGIVSRQYTGTVDVGNQITYTVTGLNSQLYYFSVTAYDSLGRESAYSNEVSKNLAGTVDTLPPLITNIASGSIASVSAKVSWSTDEPSNSQVQYGLTTAYGSSTPLDTTLVTAHSQTITTLLPATLYHYRVLSRDAAGNLSTSSDNTFITALLPDTTPPSLPANLIATPVSSSQIDLTWSASTDNVGVAGYRIYRAGVQVGTSGSASYSDKAVTPSTTYSYAVSAYDAAGNVSALSIAASATALPPGATTTVVLRPLADTFLNVNSSVNAALQTLNVYTWPANKIANAILMKFDLTSIPKGATIQSATLNLALVETDATADTSYTTTAHKIINRNPDLARATGLTYDGVNAWAANACCYNQVPLAQSDISAPYDTKIIDKTLGYKTWTLTALINEWVNQGVVNYGVLINSDPTKLTDRYRYFASSEYSDTTLRPYLSVTYQLPNTSSDTTPPIAQLKAPASGSLVKGSVPVQADLSDNVAVVSVSYFVDGVKQVTQPGTDLKSVTWSWNTAAIPNGIHRVFVQAADAAGLTGNSQEISVTVDTTPPSAPGAPTATSILQDRVTLSWSPSTDNLSSVSYRIARDGTVLSAAPATTTFTDTGLAPNRSYTYTVAAVDAAGNTSAASSPLSVKTLPLAPVVGTPTASAITSTSAALSGPVDPSGASATAWFEYGTTTAYGSSTSKVTLTAATTVSASLTALLPNTLYHFRLAAQNPGGVSRGLARTFTTLATGGGLPTTVVLKPLADTSIILNTSVNNTATTLNTYTWPANKIANAILMKFDLSGIPQGATIQSATLNLSLVESDATADATYTITAHKIINKSPDFTRATGFTYDGVNAWTANACCYNQIPLAQGDISTPYDTKAVDKTLGAKSWNLTALINEWVNQGVVNRGLLLNSDPAKLADRYRSFASSEHADTTLRPYLSVTYQLPAP